MHSARKLGSLWPHHCDNQAHASNGPPPPASKPLSARQAASCNDTTMHRGGALPLYLLYQSVRRWSWVGARGHFRPRFALQGAAYRYWLAVAGGGRASTCAWTGPGASTGAIAVAGAGVGACGAAGDRGASGSSRGNRGSGRSSAPRGRGRGPGESRERATASIETGATRASRCSWRRYECECGRGRGLGRGRRLATCAATAPVH